MGYDYRRKGRKPRRGDDLKLIWMLIVIGGGLTAALVFFVATHH